MYEGREVSVMQRILDLVGIHGWARLGAGADIIGLVMFAVLCGLLVRTARSRLA
jgi:hypothetical protein